MRAAKCESLSEESGAESALMTRVLLRRELFTGQEREFLVSFKFFLRDHFLYPNNIANAFCSKSSILKDFSILDSEKQKLN